MRQNRDFERQATKYFYPGLLSTDVASLLLAQRPQFRFLAFSKNFPKMLLKFIASTAQNSGHRLDNVNQTHQVPTTIDR